MEKFEWTTLFVVVSLQSAKVLKSGSVERMKDSRSNPQNKEMGQKSWQNVPRVKSFPTELVLEVTMYSFRQKGSP